MNKLAISPTVHKPVLVQEVLQYLDPQPHKTYLDVTFGAGGHTRAILNHEPTCRVIGLDWDHESLTTYGAELTQEFGDRFIPLWGNFAHLYKLLKKISISRVDGILADFGTSQMQIFDRQGFSFMRDTELDMRMSPAHQLITAATILNQYSEQQLADIFWELGEERYAKKIARIIVERRKQKPLQTTRDLALIVEQTVSSRGRTHPATKVFQALRMYINKELNNIRAFLPTAMSRLNAHGRLVCISFHSLEDRMVKQFFKEQELTGSAHILTKRVVIASQEEVFYNPSARSAKLRAIEVAQEYIR